MEDECHELDLQLATRIAPTQGGTSFDSHVLARSRIRELIDEKDVLQGRTSETQQLLTLLLLTTPDPQHNQQVQAAATEITLKSRRMTEIV